MAENNDPAWRSFMQAHAEPLVRLAYRAVLQRPADLSGLTSYTRLLEHSGDLGKVISSIVHSEEFWKKTIAFRATVLVEAAFHGLFGRQPEPEELRHHAAQLAQHRNLGRMLQELTNPDEHWRSNVHRPGPCFTTQDLEYPKLVFLHLPKTGGTTLHHILITAYKPEEICLERFNGLRHYTGGELATYRFFSGHFDLPSVQLIPGKKQVVTMLREPVARLVSLYHFQRAHPDEVIERENLFLARIAKQHSLVEFFQHDEIRTHPSINNAMTRVLVETVPEERWERATMPVQDDCTACIPRAMRALESMDAIGILERFDDSVTLICHTIGQERPEDIEAKQVLDTLMTKGVLHQIAREPITEAALRTISELVQADLQLYSFATKLFEARYQLLIDCQGKRKRPDDQMPIVSPHVDISAKKPANDSPS